MIEPARSIPHGVLSGTYIASTPLGPTTSRVYVQDTEGWVVETFWSKGQIRGFQRCFVAKMRTPLAVISWKENEEVAHLNETSITKQIRLYSLSVNDQLQEYAYSSRNPMAGWTAGSLPSIPALWGSRLAAVCWEDTGGDIQIRLYYQGDDYSSIFVTKVDQSAVIKELSGSLYQQWRETHSIPSAIWGSGLTAMAWGAVQGKAFRHIRVIFQDNDNNLRQSVFEDDVRQWQNGTRPSHTCFKSNNQSRGYSTTTSRSRIP